MDPQGSVERAPPSNGGQMKRYRNRVPRLDASQRHSQEQGGQPQDRQEQNGRLLQLLGVLVALCGLVLTYALARAGHETAGLVAALTVLAPLLLGRARPPE